MLSEFLHTCLIAEDRALRTFAGWVDSEDGQASAFLLQHMDAELVDTRRLACARYTTDTHPHATSTVGQTTVDDLLCLGLVVGVDTLDESDGL